MIDFNKLLYHDTNLDYVIYFLNAIGMFTEKGLTACSKLIHDAFDNLRIPFSDGREQPDFLALTSLTQLLAIVPP